MVLREGWSERKLLQLQMMMVLKVMMMVVVISVMLMRVHSISEAHSSGGEFLVSIGALLYLFHGLVKRIKERK